MIGFVRLNGNQLTIPYSNLYKKHHAPITINIPPVLLDKMIKEIRIVSEKNARFFEIQYTYEVAEEYRDLNYQKALEIDLGLNNLATCVTTEGKSFIVDGRKLKSF